MWKFLEKRLEFAISVDRDIDAPCQAVWERFIDIDRHPECITGIHSIERLDSSRKGDPLRLGTRYRVNRVNDHGEFYGGDWTVVAIDDEKKAFPKSVTFYTDNLGNGATCSSTWTVGPPLDITSDGQKKSYATISIALVPQKLFLMAGRIMCSCVFRKRAIEASDIDLRDFAAASGDARTALEVPSFSDRRLTLLDSESASSFEGDDVSTKKLQSETIQAKLVLQQDGEERNCSTCQAA